MDFIDIPGAAGTVYRFRRWPSSGSHPPIAGNFVLVAEKTRKAVAVGVVDDLSRAAQRVGTLPHGTALFTRLNIARRVRESEHSDVAVTPMRARLPPLDWIPPRPPETLGCRRISIGVRPWSVRSMRG
jgi:hypothetical protein